MKSKDISLKYLLMQGDILADGSYEIDVDAFLKQECQTSIGHGAARSADSAQCKKKENVTLDSDDDSDLGQGFP